MTDDQQGSVPAPQGTTPTDPTAVDATVTDTTAPVAADATPADPTPTDPTPAEATSTEAPSTEAPSTEAPAPETTPSEATTETSATPIVAAVGYGEPAAPAAYAQPGHDQPGYGQPAYGQPAPAAGTDGMSIAALVTAILGMGLIPLILGILGLKRTKANGTSGRGLAIAGIVLGALEIVGSIILTIALVVGGAAAFNELNEASDAASAAAEELEALEELPTEEEIVEDDTALSATPLKDAVPLEVAGFTSPGVTDNPLVLAVGALEAYGTAYTNGTDTVTVAASTWATTEDAVAFATSQGAAYTPEQLVEQGELEGVVGQYWVYVVDGVTTLVTTYDTLSTSFSGPEAAVFTLYPSFPL